MLSSPRWRKIYADLRLNKTRTLIVVLSIVVGIFAIGSITGTQAILSREIKATYNRIDPASAVLVGSTFDKTLVDAIAAREEVAIVEGRRNFNAKVVLDGGESQDIRIFAVDDYSNMRLNRIQPEEGAFPPPPMTILIERSALGLVGAEIGDTITIRTPSGQEVQMAVDGTTYDLSQPAAQILGIAYGYVTFETLEMLGEERLYNELHIKLAQPVANEDEVRPFANAIRDYMEQNGVVIFTVFVPPVDEPAGFVFIQALLLVLGVVGSLTFLLSGFLIINIISALLTQQTRQIGIMKAVGGKTSQITAMYLGMVLIFGVLALAIGMPLSYFGARGLATAIGGLSNYRLENFSLPWWVFALQILIGLLVPVLAAIVPIFFGTRVSVRRALDSRGIDASRHGLLNRVLTRLQGLPRPLLMSIRNTFRQRVRLALTLFTLTLAGAIFATVFTVRSSLYNTLDEALGYENYDVLVDFVDAHPIAEVEAIALNTEGVTAVEAWGEATGRYKRPDASESEDIIITALPIGSQMILPILQEGRWLQDGDTNAVVLNGNLAKEESGLKVGDSITLIIRGRESTWTVVGITRSVFSLENIIYTSTPALNAAIGEDEQTRLLKVSTTDSTEATQNAVASALGEAFSANGFIVETTQTTADLESSFDSRFNSLVFSLLALAVLLAIVGGLGIAGTTSINVIERMREIGVMRAVGASDGAVLRVFVFEAIFVSLIGWVLGSLLALPISRFLSDGVGVAFSNNPLTYEFSVFGAVLWLVVALGLALLSSMLPAIRASRITLNEVLSYE